MPIQALHAARERPADPCLKARMIVGCAAAAWKPASEEPLQRTEFEIGPTAHFDLRDCHWRTAKPADVALRCEALGLDGNAGVSYHGLSQDLSRPSRAELYHTNRAQVTPFRMHAGSIGRDVPHVRTAR